MCFSQKASCHELAATRQATAVCRIVSVPGYDGSFSWCIRSCALGRYPDAGSSWLKCMVALVKPQCCLREGCSWRRMAAEFYHSFLPEIASCHEVAATRQATAVSSKLCPDAL